jgi:hypothetical protein
MTNEQRERKWNSYDIERPEKILAIVWAMIIILLLIYAIISK